MSEAACDVCDAKAPGDPYAAWLQAVNFIAATPDSPDNWNSYTTRLGCWPYWLDLISRKETDPAKLVRVLSLTQTFYRTIPTNVTGAPACEIEEQARGALVLAAHRIGRRLPLGTSGIGDPKNYALNLVDFALRASTSWWSIAPAIDGAQLLIDKTTEANLRNSVLTGLERVASARGTGVYAEALCTAAKTALDAMKDLWATPEPYAPPDIDPVTPIEPLIEPPTVEPPVPIAPPLPAAAPAGLSRGAKIAIGVSIAAVLGVAGYLILGGRPRTSGARSPATPFRFRRAALL